VRAATDDLAARFEDVAQVLRDLDIAQLWGEATLHEQRVLLAELLEAVHFFPDHLEVAVAGAPRLNIALGEVWMAGASTDGVGGGT